MRGCVSFRIKVQILAFCTDVCTAHKPNIVPHFAGKTLKQYLTQNFASVRDNVFDPYKIPNCHTYMRPHPRDGMERGLLLLVDGPVGRLEIRVLKQLAPIPTEPLDVLVVGLLEATLQTAIHRPIPR